MAMMGAPLTASIFSQFVNPGDIAILGAAAGTYLAMNLQKAAAEAAAKSWQPGMTDAQTKALEQKVIDNSTAMAGKSIYTPTAYGQAQAEYAGMGGQMSAVNPQMLTTWSNYAQAINSKDIPSAIQDLYSQNLVWYKGSAEAFSQAATQKTADMNAMLIAQTKLKAEDIGPLMRSFAPVAQTYGMSQAMAETTAGSLAQMGLEPSQAGNMARRLLLRFTPNVTDLQKQEAYNQGVTNDKGQIIDESTGKAISMSNVDKALNQLHLTWQDLDASSKGLPAVIGTIGEAMKKANFTPLDTEAWMKTVTGLQGITGMSMLKDPAYYDQLLQKIMAASDGIGASAAQSKIQTDNLWGSLEMLKSGLVGLGDDIGSVTTGPAKNFVDFLRGPALMGVEALGNAINKGDWKGAADIMGSAFNFMGQKATDAFNTISSALTNKDTWNTFGDIAKGALTSAQDSLLGLSTGFKDFATGGGISTGLTGAKDWITNVLSGLDMGKLSTIGDNIWTGFKSGATEAIGWLADNVPWDKVAGGLTDALTGAISGIGDFIDGLPWDKIYKTLDTVATTVWTHVKNWIGGQDWDWIGTKIGEGIGTAAGMIASWFTKELGKVTWSEVGTRVKSAVDAIGSGAFVGLQTAGIVAFNAIGSAAANAGNAIAQGIQIGVNAAIGAFANLTGAALRAFAAIGGSSAAGIIHSLAGGTSSALEGQSADVTKAISLSNGGGSLLGGALTWGSPSQYVGGEGNLLGAGTAWLDQNLPGIAAIFGQGPNVSPSTTSASDYIHPWSNSLTPGSGQGMTSAIGWNLTPKNEIVNPYVSATSNLYHMTQEEAIAQDPDYKKYVDFVANYKQKSTEFGGTVPFGPDQQCADYSKAFNDSWDKAYPNLAYKVKMLDFAQQPLALNGHSANAFALNGNWNNPNAIQVSEPQTGMMLGQLSYSPLYDPFVMSNAQITHPTPEQLKANPNAPDLVAPIVSSTDIPISYSGGDLPKSFGALTPASYQMIYGNSAAAAANKISAAAEQTASVTSIDRSSANLYNTPSTGLVSGTGPAYTPSKGSPTINQNGTYGGTPVFSSGSSGSTPGTQGSGSDGYAPIRNQAAHDAIKAITDPLGGLLRDFNPIADKLGAIVGSSRVSATTSAPTSTPTTPTLTFPPGQQVPVSTAPADEWAGISPGTKDDIISIMDSINGLQVNPATIKPYSFTPYPLPETPTPSDSPTIKDMMPKVADNTKITADGITALSNNFANQMNQDFLNRNKLNAGPGTGTGTETGTGAGTGAGTGPTLYNPDYAKTGLTLGSQANGNFSGGGENPVTIGIINDKMGAYIGSVGRNISPSARTSEEVDILSHYKPDTAELDKTTGELTRNPINLSTTVDTSGMSAAQKQYNVIKADLGDGCIAPVSFNVDDAPVLTAQANAKKEITAQVVLQTQHYTPPTLPSIYEPVYTYNAGGYSGGSSGGYSGGVDRSGWGSPSNFVRAASGAYTQNAQGLMFVDPHEVVAPEQKLLESVAKGIEISRGSGETHVHIGSLDLRGAIVTGYDGVDSLTEAIMVSLEEKLNRK